MTGRPPKFKTPEELAEKVDAYFAGCKANEKMPTKAGLALHLDTTKETLGDYIQKEGFSDSIKKAYLLIENAWTENLTKQSPVGSIFYLKAACGYRDRVDVTTNEKDLPAPILPLNELRSDDDHAEG